MSVCVRESVCYSSMYYVCPLSHVCFLNSSTLIKHPTGECGGGVSFPQLVEKKTTKKQTVSHGMTRPTSLSLRENVI